MVMKKMNIGLIGLGRLGSLYAGYLAGRVRGAQLVAVADSSEGVAEPIADALGIERRCRDYQDLLAQKNIDAIVVTTPTSTHKDVVVDAAKSDYFETAPATLQLVFTDRTRDQVDAWRIEIPFDRRSLIQ